MKIFFLVGEDSGDMMGAKIIAQLKKSHPQVNLYGLAGNEMEQLGMKSIFPIKNLSIMGFAEVLPKIWQILGLINKTVATIQQTQPDIIISIDSPDFCFRVIKKINQNQKIKAKKIHLVAPSVWAYRPKRAEKISKIYDLLLTLLPFEPPYFEKYGLKAKFVGHHGVESAKQQQKKFSKEKIIAIRKDLRISPDKQIICITVGSRNNEVDKILPEAVGALKIIQETKNKILPIFVVTKNTKTKVTEFLHHHQIDNIIVESERKYEVFAIAKMAIAKSGTNNLEMLAFGLPIITIYKANYLTYWIMKSISKIKFANLVNICAQKEIIPELIQANCNSKKIANLTLKMLEDDKFLQNQLQQTKDIISNFTLKDGFAQTIVKDSIFKIF